MKTAYPDIHVVLVEGQDGQFRLYDGVAHTDQAPADASLEMASYSYHAKLVTFTANPVEQPYYEITAEDVHKGLIKAFGREWLTTDFLGRIMKQDIGKRVFLRGAVHPFLQIENAEQLATRLAKK